MAHPHISAVTIVYRGASHHFATVAYAVRFLRGDDVRTGWFRKVTADVQVGSDDVTTETRHLKGQKYTVISALEQLARDFGAQ
jgi:hypothetical protein